MLLIKYAPANAKDHGTMPLKQRFKRALVLLRHESLDERTISESGAAGGRHNSANVLQETIQSTVAHRSQFS